MLLNWRWIKIKGDEAREYLLKHYGFNFPKKARYIRDKNRIYFSGDFDDNESIEFAWACDKPSSNALGYSYYYSSNKGYKLVSIKEIIAIE